MHTIEHLVLRAALPMLFFATLAHPLGVDTVYPPAPVGSYFALDAYQLTPAQEMTFDTRDERISPFWHCWDSADAILDQIEINCTYTGNYLGYEHSEDGFTGEDDARMWVRAAWGVDGVYLYIKVRDDQFVSNAVYRCYGSDFCQTQSDASWYNDAIDMYMDKYSTSMLYSAPEVLFTNFNRDRRTISMVQIQYQLVNSGFFSYNRMTQTVDGRYEYVPEREFTFTRALTEADGMTGEVLFGPTEGLSDTARVLEWFQPWSQVGGDGGTTAPEPGRIKEIAFAVGYNDADAGATDSDYIRWVRAADPFKRIPPPEGGAHVPTDGWGDIRCLPTMCCSDSHLPPVATPQPIAVQSPTLEHEPLLKWHGVGDAAGYQLLIDTTAALKSPLHVFTVSDTFHALGTSLPHGWIYWCVRTTAPSPFSPPDSFFVQPDSIPPATRFHGDTISLARPSLRWGSIDEADTYRVEMDTSSAFTAPFISTLTTDTVFDPLIDLEEGTYYWRVATALPPSGFTLPDSFTITATAARHPISASYSIPSPSVPALLGGARAPYLLVRGARARSLTVMVVSAGGRRVFTGSYNPRNGAARIALPSLPAGIYFIGVGARDARRLDFRRYVLR